MYAVRMDRDVSMEVKDEGNTTATLNTRIKRLLIILYEALLTVCKKGSDRNSQRNGTLVAEKEDLRLGREVLRMACNLFNNNLLLVYNLFEGH